MRDAALKADIARLSQRQGVTERALREFVRRSNNRDVTSLRSGLEAFADQLSDAQRQIDELRRDVADLKAADRQAATGSLDEAQLALESGQVDRMATLLSAYESLQTKRYDDRMWGDIVAQLQQGNAIPIETRTALVNSYIVDNAYGQHKAEANQWLARLEQEKAQVRSRTPWVAGYGKRIVAEVSGTLSDVALFADGRRMAVGDGQGTVRTYDVGATGGTGKAGEVAVGGGAINAIALSPDNVRLAVASSDGSITILDARNGRIEKRLQGHIASATSVRWSHDGRSLISTSRDTSVKLWDVRGGRLIRDVIAPHPCAVPERPDPTLRARNTSGREAACSRYFVSGLQVREASFGPADRTAVVAFFDKAVVHDMASGRRLASLGADPGIGDMYSTSISPDGKTLFTVEKFMGARLWNAETNRARCSLSDVRRPIRGALSPDGRFAVIATEDNLLIIADLDCKVLAELEGHGFPANGFVIAANGRAIASVSDDGRLILWEDQSQPSPAR